MNIIDEINTLIKKHAPRPYFTSQEHLEDIIQNESLAEVRADFVMDEWVIGHITEIIEKYQDPKTQKEINEVLDKIRAELHTTAEMHEDENYYLRDEWIDEIIDKYKAESEG